MSDRLLNTYQRNSVSITLRTLETTLRMAMTDLNSQQQGILYRQKVTLTEPQYEQIKQTILMAMGEISHLADALSLPVEVQDNRANLQSQLAILWSDLQDMRAAKLKAYGEVAPGLEAALDPSVLRLSEFVQSLMAVLAEKKP
jgi:hypothetical protein